MSTQNIIELAREAGFNEAETEILKQEITSFAALVRKQALEEAAGVCDEQAHDWHLHAKGGPVAAYNACAAAIRALKDKP